MAEEILKKFGRYFLLDRIAQGGMAEIYRARLATLDGASRLLVIKRIQTGHGGNREFQQMFRSETKVMMGFNHSNIVQVYDFGEENEQPYIAMEFIDGKNLRQVINRCAEMRQPFPVEFSVWIVEQAAAGLHYAHSYKDKISGQALNIVHRDVSPQNILVSYDGTVKVIDFGIAKATVNSEATRAGIIKGKPSYLSPEQVEGAVLDGRSDLFSLGIVLWELLAGRKLFQASGESEFAVLKLIESCQTYVKPPSTVNPSIPPELDAIIMRALTKDPNQRFQTGEEFQRALHKFLYAFKPEFNPNDLAYMAKNLFKDDMVKDRKRLQELNTKVEQLLAADYGDAPSLETPSETRLPGAPDKDTTTFVDHRRGMKPVEISMNPREMKQAGPISLNERASDYQSQRVARQQRPASEKKKKSGQKSGGSKWVRLGLIAAGLGAIAVYLPTSGLLSSSPKLDEEEIPSKPVTAQNEPAKKAPPANSVLLKLNITPGGGGETIRLNGHPISADNPAARVPQDSPMELQIDRRGFKSYRKEFVLTKNQLQGSAEWVMAIDLEPVQYGYVTIHTTPSADGVIQYQDQSGRYIASETRPWIIRTPAENLKFPVGSYRVILENRVLGMSKIIQLNVQDGKSIRRDERLEVH